MEWTNELPSPLKDEVNEIVVQNPKYSDVLTRLYQWVKNGDLEPAHKKQKQEPPVQNGIQNNEIIFELSQISFQSPIRKKSNLVFHLIEQNNTPAPALSITNPTDNTPLLTFKDLSNSIKLCFLLPILGNSTNPQKKSTVSLLFWIDDQFAEDPSKNDPVICQINLDIVKKQMIKAGKLPANVDNQLNNESGTLDLNPVQERIIDYFQRQFRLCGINLINYSPSNSLFSNKLTLNTDTGVALSTKSSGEEDFLLIDAHKGSKEGALVFASSNHVNKAFIMYGFKKPVVLYEISQIKDISYSNITRNTFSIILSIEDKNETKNVEYSMIDQNYFQAIDGFVKRENISDNSFDQKFQEKDKQQEQQKNQPDGSGAPDADDDDEEDDNFQVEEESDVAEEFDSNAESEGEEDGVFNKAKEEEEE